MHVQMVISSKIAGIFSKAYLSTCAMELSVLGFSATGISSFNQNIFRPEEFNVVSDDSEAMESSMTKNEQLKEHSASAKCLHTTA